MKSRGVFIPLYHYDINKYNKIAVIVFNYVYLKVSLFAAL